MRKYLLFALLFFSISSQAQTYSKVKVLFGPGHQMTDLAALGLDCDHGRHQPQRYFIGEFADFELDDIQAAGFETEILIADLKADLLERNAAFHEHGPETQISTRTNNCDGHAQAEYATPANYVYGSMGGYVTYQQMLDELDKMAGQFPGIFKARTPITTDYTTHGNRPIYWVKISDNPSADEADEPEVLFTALHHAREPNSLSQMIFYMWYLLENYATDEEVKYLVDNEEMYFVPCLNPDGYVYNESTDPNGGGFWRKNRKDNGNNTFGVDLNRNYPYQWGYDDQGSSPNTNSETYRGTAPGSEPETQMIMEFCEAHQFQIALNYHTSGDLLIYPWGYVDGASPDHWSFTELSGFMKQDNNFLAGFASQTVGYTVNGTSDDWMYGEQTTKNKIMSMTPEVGPAFWPTAGEIDALNKSCMKMNLNTAHLVLNLGVLNHASDAFISAAGGKIDYGLRKIGLQPGLLRVSLEPVSNNIQSVGQTDNFGLLHLETAVGNIPFTLKTGISEGELVQFELVLDNGLYQWREPITFIFTTNVGTEVAEPGDDLSQWSGQDWAATTEHFHSAPSSITDSEGGVYPVGAFNDISLNEPIVIEDANDVRLTFWARWEIEEDEDHAQLWASINGGNSFPLCGKYSELGTDEQALDEPVYDGLQEAWVREEIDLTEYLDANGDLALGLTFYLFSDEAVNLDGFYFDDLAVTVVYNETSTNTHQLDASQFTVTTRPNPAGDYAFLDFEGEIALFEGLNLQVFNTLGQMVANQTIQGKVLQLNTSGWMPGVYHYRVADGKQVVPKGRFVVE